MLVAAWRQAGLRTTPCARVSRARAVVAATRPLCRAPPPRRPSPTTIANLRELERKLVWLSTFTVHNANNLRPSRDGLKVGGHQASSSSLATVLTVLYFCVLGRHDRISIKPHAGPLMHAIGYVVGRQTKEALQRFRGLGGVQSYPSLTKDKGEIDFSTGSVGLGATITTFAAYVADFLGMKGRIPPEVAGGRMVAVVGDAELDEGNVYEALMEGQRLGITRNWYVVDYNRQSLDKVTPENNFRNIERMFRSVGWDVVVVKYGKRLVQAFAQPGGKALRAWLNKCDNALYSALCFKGGKEFRKQIQQDIGNEPGVAELLSSRSDSELFSLMTDLGGHCPATLVEAFEKASQSSQPTAFIVYTIKGYGLPMSGHFDNHGLYLNQAQMDSLYASHNVRPGNEWDKYEGVSREAVDACVRMSQYFTNKNRDMSALAPLVPVPDVLPCKVTPGEKMSTQFAFGQIMFRLASDGGELADSVMTMAPDVTTTTNLSGFLNKRGLFGTTTNQDPSKRTGVLSMNKWDMSPQGQHIQLGIAEHNVMTLLSAAGLSHRLFGRRVFPVGTVYDPFIARGLDAMNYGCYSDSRFMLVATPSGLTLAPEGGAHQSVYTPLIGMGQPAMTYFEPSFADELQVMMAWGFQHMQQPAGKGGSVYLRLSTRGVVQPQREMTNQLRADILRGAYWLHQPTEHTRVCVAYCGVLVEEVAAARAALAKELGDNAVAVLQVTSADVLFREWSAEGPESHAARTLSMLPPSTPLVTVLDGHPATLGWLGSVCGSRVASLGVSRFGQSGDLPDLYREYGLDAPAIVAAVKRSLPTQGAPAKPAKPVKAQRGDEAAQQGESQKEGRGWWQRIVG